MNKHSKNFDVIIKENKCILIYIGTKNIYELAECDIDKVNDCREWKPFNMNNKAGYAWLSNEKRPYGKFIKHGFLKSTKTGEFIVDFVCICDNHYNKGIYVDSFIDHIIVRKRTDIKKDSILESNTFIKIENNNFIKVLPLI